MNRIVFVLFVLIHCILISNGRSGNFEVILENMTACLSPQPPLAKDPYMLHTFNIQRRKQKTYISGEHLVVKDVPFLNFSVSTYSLGAGKEDLQTMIENLSCHSWISRAYLTFGKFRYNKKDCRVRKGTYGFSNIDMNAILHSIPNYHDKGRLVHKWMLVHNGSTVFCNDMKLTVRDMKTAN